MSKSRLFVLVALATLALHGSADAQAPAAPTLQIAPQAPQEKVLAVVGNEKITSTQVDAIAQRQLRGQQAPPETMARLRKMIVESLIQNELVTMFVAAKNVSADAKEVDAMIADIKNRVAAQGVDLATVLKAQGLTEKSFREQIESELAVEKYAKSQVTDAKAREYFNAHKKEFDGTKVKASHILLKYDAGSTAQEKKAAGEKIAAIRKEIVAGADFAEAAKKHSACPSSAEGGDLGPGFGRHGQMVEPFAAAAFRLPVGQVSEPVETEFGVHLIKVTDVKPGSLTFDEAKDDVKGTLYQQLLEKAADEQRKVTKVEIFN